MQPISTRLSCCKTETPYPLNNSISFPLPPALATTCLFSVSVNLQNQAVFVCLRVWLIALGVGSWGLSALDPVSGACLRGAEQHCGLCIPQCVCPFTCQWTPAASQLMAAVNGAAASVGGLTSLQERPCLQFLCVCTWKWEAASHNSAFPIGCSPSRVICEGSPARGLAEGMSHPSSFPTVLSSGLGPLWVLRVLGTL